MRKPRFSIIIPVLNDAGRLDECLTCLRAFEGHAEIIVVDGGSGDDSAATGRHHGCIVCSSQRGRGIQCRVGAEQARGEILLFHHVDTLLPDGALSFLDNTFNRADVNIGTFRLRFDSTHWFLRLSGFCTRFDTVFTRFGDQCIVVRKSFLEALGGFPALPLLEDVELLRHARRRTPIHSFPLAVTTSARRFLQNGIFRQQLFNGLLIIRYLLGAPPQQLARDYEQFSRTHCL